MSSSVLSVGDELLSDSIPWYGNYSYSYDFYYFQKPWAISPGGQAVLVAIYSVTALLAIVGNTTVIVVLSCNSRSLKNLNSFLINLAVSDVTMAIFGIPFSFVQAMLGHWVFGRGLCKVVAFMQQVSVTTSIYTLVAISVDRFLAVFYPMRKRMSTSSAKVAIILIWGSAMSLSVVQLVYVQVQEFPVSPTEQLLVCDEVWQKRTGIAYEIFIMTITSLIPFCVLGVTYYLVARRLWGRSIPGNAHHDRDAVYARSKRKVVKMMAIVVGLFAFCWLPLNILNVLGRFTLNKDRPSFVIYYFCCHWLAMANSFINPIVYGLVNDNFRTDLKQMWTNCFSGPLRRRRSQITLRSRTNSSNGQQRGSAQNVIPEIKITVEV